MMPFAVGTVRDIPVRALKLCGMTWFGECLCFSEAVSEQIIMVDPVTGEVQHRIPCAGVLTDLTTANGLLLQVAGDQRCIRVVNPGNGGEIGEIANPRPGHKLRGLEANRHGLWLGYDDLHLVELRDPRELTLIDVFQVRRGIAGLTASDSYLIYADQAGGTINVYDLEARREIAGYSVAGNPTGLAWDGQLIWYCDFTTLQLRAVELPGLVRG
ncbi:hypothetical protein [Actinoplanes sp. TFC3]|uniref:hypothetical protein n=1 Tax=Actinoplanes sp. TFC3 TaxID=1710355 RepID=UPI000B325168|nr:hypothetical protein [Actinoplanes sp. TFC3]